ncbi:MAG: hypothetical protein QGG36_02515 [Pirellulaceae bacterium]|jgi:hypothetical protein|nr:hypothetical protein [Pirellulaceae bacterium]MDP7014650.1 hypothetical protein [Pirellulaceae bacterium]
MKRLLILTAIAALTVSSAGCCRTWSNWWNRGAACDTCYDGVVYDDVVDDYGELPPGRRERVRE